MFIGQILSTLKQFLSLARGDHQSPVQSPDGRSREFINGLVHLIFVEDLRGAGSAYGNDRWTEYVGHRVDTIDGEFWRQVIHPDDLPKVASFYGESRKTGLGCRYEYRIRRHDGVYRWHVADSSPVRGSSGGIEQWISSSTDIHEQKTAEEDRIRLIAELEQKTGLLEAVLDNMPSGVVFADQNNKIILKNRKLIKFFNMDDTYRIGSLKAFHLSDGRPYQLHELPIPTAIRTGLPVQAEINVPDLEGNPRIFRFNSAPIFLKSGKILYGVSIIDDITLQKKEEADRAQHLVDERAALATKRSKELMETLVDNIPHLIFLKDADTMQYTQVNKAGRKALGLNAGELLGDSAQNVLGEDADLINEADQKVAQTGEPVDIPMHFINLKNQTMRVFNTRKFIITQEDGKRIIVGISSDITEIAQQKDQAEQLAKMKSEFLATMSHEIRTPLNGVLGMSELILEGNLEEQQRKYMEILKGSGDALLTIVNNILDFSKAEGRHIHFEKIPFLIRSVFQGHFEILKMRAQAKDLSLTYEFDHRLPNLLNGDPNRIAQILNNLIGNAIKFTEHGQIAIRVSVASIDTHQAVLHFSIADTGIGISREKKARLFKPFVQGDGSMARKYGGTGLGLSICKQLVELMDGEISVENKTGGGSNFWFTIKLEIPQTNQISQKSEVILNLPPQLIPSPIEIKNNLPFDPEYVRAHRGSSKYILVAEDNVTNQVLVQAILKKMGYHTHVVANGKEALEACQKFDYDAVLMDCQMPELDGYEATIRIRENEKQTTKHVPIIALTANARPQDQAKCISVGMDDFVPKPIKRDLLKQILERWSKTA